jgi:hypothetical protein
MKKFKVYLVLALISMVFVFNSCNKVSEKNCDELSNNFTSASTAFGTNPSEATCNDYKAAWDDWMDGCPVSAAYIDQFEALMESIDCTIY